MVGGGVMRAMRFSIGVEVPARTHAVAAGAVPLVVNMKTVHGIRLEAADLAGDENFAALADKPDGAYGRVALGRCELRGCRGRRRGDHTGGQQHRNRSQGERCFHGYSFSGWVEQVRNGECEPGTGCAVPSHHQRIFLHRFQLLLQHLHLALPVVAGTEPRKVDGERRIVPAPRQPCAVVNQAQGTQGLN